MGGSEERERETERGRVGGRGGDVSRGRERERERGRVGGGGEERRGREREGG